MDLQEKSNLLEQEIVDLNKVNVQVVQTPSTGVNLFRSGELDYTTLTSDFVKQYQIILAIIPKLRQLMVIFLST